MKIIEKLIAIFVASSVVISPIFAQSSTVVSIERDLSVGVTVGASTLTAELEIISPVANSNGDISVNFNNGNALFAGTSAGDEGQGSQNSRYVSEPVILDYVAPSGPWDIRIYTTRLDKLSGLVDSTLPDSASNTSAQIAAANTIPLKFTTGSLTGTNPVNIGDNDDWTGDSARFSFVIPEALDQSDSNRFFFRLASSAFGSAPASDDFEFRFGVDVLGTAVGSYSADVTIELYIQ